LLRRGLGCESGLCPAARGVARPWQSGFGLARHAQP